MAEEVYADKVLKEWQKVLAELKSEFERSGVFSDEFYIVGAVEELRSNGGKGKSLGVRLFIREYNLNERDYESAWQIYRDTCNGIQGDCETEIEFNPPNYKDLGKLLIDSARRIDSFEEKVMIEELKV